MERTSDIGRAVLRVARRRRAARALHLAMRAAVVLGIALAAFALVLRLASLPLAALWVAAICCAGALLAVFLVAFSRRTRLFEESKRLDDLLGLKDRLTSALFFAREKEGREPLKVAAIADAASHLARLEDVPSGINGSLKTLCAACAAFIAAAAIALVPIPGVSGPARDGDRAARADKQRGDPSARTPDAAKKDESADTTSQKGRETELGETDLGGDASAKGDATMASLGNELAQSGLNEAERLLAQAAYLNAEDLADSGQPKDGPANTGPTYSMKNPDMDMIKQMLNNIKDQEKKGQRPQEAGDDINMEVLIKTAAAQKADGERTRPGDSGAKGGSGGPSQDTRIKPKRVPIEGMVEFRVECKRAVNTAAKPDLKKVEISEVMMLASVGQKLIAKPEPAVASAAEPPAATPMLVEDIPPTLRLFVSRYFKGLQETDKHAGETR